LPPSSVARRAGRPLKLLEKKKLEWLRKYFPFANGVPSHDCIRMVLISLSPKALQGCFARWLQAVVEVAKGEVVAIDGKTIRRSFDLPGRRQPTA
jgi:DDE_Tnp_1-associated